MTASPSTLPSTLIDELLPIRRINEYVYCPRLFWFEQVEGVFLHNEHTLEGKYVHRHVDKPGGRIRAPTAVHATFEGEEEDSKAEEYWQARSLWLSNTELGVTGKIDLVEAHDDCVMPVDTKKGRSAPGKTLWPSDEVQLTLQALLLRRSGYRVEQIAAWYVKERRRVVVQLNQERIDQATEAVRHARGCLEGDKAPAPLMDSPKCPGCSLNLICLPDETNCLLGEQTAPEPEETNAIRRVIPARDDATPIYLQSPGSRVSLAKHCLKLTPRRDLQESPQLIGFAQLSHLNLLGSVQITTQALAACLKREVSVCFFSGGGYFYGRTLGFGNRQVQVRIAQFKAVDEPVALHISQVLVSDKIANCRTLLRRNRPNKSTFAQELRQLARRRDAAESAESSAQLLGFEGDAARQYWCGFDQLVSSADSSFKMQGRNRRPPKDATNALLSFAYALLVKDCTLAVAACGLDPMLGLYHTPHHGRPSLALDLMEPFRPLIADSIVLQIIRRQAVKPKQFVNTGQAVRMKEAARKTLIQAYERRMDELVTHPVFGYRISYRQVLAVQARLLSRVLTGELPTFPSFRTR